MATNKKNIKIIGEASKIPDIQGLADTRNLPINKVGIKDILHPIIIKQRSGNKQSTIAQFNMYVDLPHDFKGTHMSRFVQILNQHEEQITVDSFKEMMEEMKNKDEFTKKVYKNWSIFRKKIIQLSPMTELGYMSLREKFKEII